MTIENAEKSRCMLNERDALRSFLDVCSNYDSHMTAVVGSFHNNNQKVYIERKFELPRSLKNEIQDLVKMKINEIDLALEML